ncbi:MarR family winged helix-turn-helix transcriptional regulator [Streptomyces sp. 3214.6]|uniref:MarR family winged helix-turn-helix transcriptional regulator n=1 Tax=Streptomyces sp. 3214.6 TaxID=1882757 RepID=UPI00090CBDEF|nr:MarR family winged helix-turn-helix transcriptional regulator [Streptomyces sp. 3214.6]SHI19095.1 DNA-binding transcriptional regulator, MarR family [Streptomyces sp. 3214.6]
MKPITMKPIGYWLNRTDKALTRYMNGMLDEFGLTRTAWQVLNVIRDTPDAADTDVHTALAPNADLCTLTAAIDTVLADDWATRPAPGRLELTANGRRRLVAVEDRISAFRELSMTGITAEEYRTAVSVLACMTHNLETR